MNADTLDRVLYAATGASVVLWLVQLWAFIHYQKRQIKDGDSRSDLGE